MQNRNKEFNAKVMFTAEIPVRITDINYGRHLGHDSLITMLHEARVQFLNHYGYAEYDVGGCGLIMANINVNYLAEVFYPDALLVSMGIGEKTKSSLEILYQIKSKEQGKDVANASTIMVFYDYDKKRVVRVPDNLSFEG